MIPDLGKYTATVLSAYGATLVLLAVLVGISWVQARRSKALLAQVEKRAQETSHG